MAGAIAGDIIGSVFEASPIKTTDFELFSEWSGFTDDTVLTVATAHALLTGMDYTEAYRTFGRRYPRAGYGGAFIKWMLADDAPPYNSWGNGSARWDLPGKPWMLYCAKPQKVPPSPIVIRKASGVLRRWLPRFSWGTAVSLKKTFAGSSPTNLHMT